MEPPAGDCGIARVAAVALDKAGVPLVGGVVVSMEKLFLRGPNRNLEVRFGVEE